VIGKMSLESHGKFFSKPSETRKAYYGRKYGLLDTPILGPRDVTDKPREGPLIVECYDTTIVVPPKCHIQRGESDTFVIDIWTSESHNAI
jgi:hypothetical protein